MRNQPSNSAGLPPWHFLTVNSPGPSGWTLAPPPKFPAQFDERFTIKVPTFTQVTVVNDPGLGSVFSKRADAASVATPTSKNGFIRVRVQDWGAPSNSQEPSPPVTPISSASAVPSRVGTPPTHSTNSTPRTDRSGLTVPGQLPQVLRPGLVPSSPVTPNGTHRTTSAARSLGYRPAAVVRPALTARPAPGSSMNSWNQFAWRPSGPARPLFGAPPPVPVRMALPVNLFASSRYASPSKQWVNASAPGSVRNSSGAHPGSVQNQGRSQLPRRGPTIPSF